MLSCLKFIYILKGLAHIVIIKIEALPRISFIDEIQDIFDIRIT